MGIEETEVLEPDSPETEVAETPESVEAEQQDLPEEQESLEAQDYDSEVDSDEEPESPDEPAYQPDFSYQVLDDEYEMPEHLRKYIGSKEDEDVMRDLVARAHGLDVVKQDRQHLRDENTNLVNIERTRQDAVSQMQQMIKNGDLKSFLNQWQVDEDAVLQHAHQILQLREMDPHQRAEYERQEQVRSDAYQYQQQNQYLQQQNMQLQQQQVAQQVNYTLNSPEFSDLVSNYDQSQGRQGAFREEVGKLGEYYYLSQGRMVPPDQLVREVANRFAWQQPQPQQHHEVQPQQQQAPRHRTVQRQNRPTLPRVRSSGASPIKSSPKSIEALRELHQAMVASGS